MHHSITTPTDHPCGSNWLRVTIGMEKVRGEWKVIHEHVSSPFNPMTNEAWKISDPEDLSQPDYSQCKGAES